MRSVCKPFILFVMVIISQNINGIGVYGGQVVVLHSPKSLKLQDNFGKHQEVLKELYSAVLGFPIPQKDRRNLIYFVDPFDTPEAVVEVHITGVSDIGPFYGSYRTYSMPGYCNSHTFEYVTAKLTKFYSNSIRSKQVKIRLNDEHDLQKHKDLTCAVKNLSEIHTNILNRSDPTTKQLFKELNVLYGITAALNNNSIARDYIKDFYNFQVKSLQPIVEKYGNASAQTLEAKRLLNQQLVPLSEAFVKIYDGDVLITAVASENDSVVCQREERQVTVRSKHERGQWKKLKAGSVMKGKEVARDIWKADESVTNDVKKGKQMTGEIESEKNAVVRNERKNRKRERKRNAAIIDNSKTSHKETETEGIKEWNVVEPKPKKGPINSEIDNKYKHMLKQDETPKTSKTSGIETPIIIQIMFWTCFFLSFAVIATVQVFMTLDPGRDSIVYRLTDNLITKKTE